MATKKTTSSAKDTKKDETKATKKAPAKKTAAKKAEPTEKATKKAEPKKATKKATAAKKPAEKKPAAKKAVAKKETSEKKPAAKKAESKEKATKKAAAAKKPAEKKEPAKKKPAAKKPAEKAPAEKAPAKKTSAKKTPAKKTPAKKAAPKAEPKEVEPPVEVPEPADAEQTAPPSAEAVAELIEELAGPARRRRQDASHELGIIAKEHPEVLENSIDELIDALYRPEAQTRWEILLALSELAGSYATKVAGAFDGAEASLFDEGSATVRLAAFGFLASYGATSPARSDDAWPLLDEAIQCYHGDSEYRDMLGYLLIFVKGKISKESKAALVDRVTFDATSGRGYVQVCSTEIIEAAKTKK